MTRKIVSGVTKYTEKNDDGESKESTIRKVTMPYVTKLLFQELMAMGISPKIKVKDINHI